MIHNVLETFDMQQVSRKFVAAINVKQNKNKLVQGGGVNSNKLSNIGTQDTSDKRLCFIQNKNLWLVPGNPLAWGQLNEDL